MKRFLIGLFALMTLPGVAMAQVEKSSPAPVDVTGLTAAQIAEINAQIEAKRTETPEGKVRESIARANEWVDIGEGIGAGVAAAARETGLVVNEFAKTPVGKMTTFVILFKVVGKDLLGLVIGSIVLVFFWTVWLVYTRSLFGKEKNVVTEGSVKTVTYREREWTEGQVGACAMAVVLLVVVTALLLIVIL